MRSGSPGILVIESGWITKAYQCDRCGDDSQSDAGLTLIPLRIAARSHGTPTPPRYCAACVAGDALAALTEPTQTQLARQTPVSRIL